MASGNGECPRWAGHRGRMHRGVRRLLQGVITQILRHRLKVAPTKQKAFIANTCRMLIKGVS
jgi:hypothetical protein